MPVVTIRNLAGEICWGPLEVGEDEEVQDLLEDLVPKLGHPAFGLQLLHGTEVVTKLGSEDVELTVQLLSAEGFVSRCSEFLATCPEGEEHKAWLLEAEEKLVKPMEMLLSFDAKDLMVARALCLKLLALERTDWYGSTQERYPDGATIAALEILRRVASKGDAEVVRVLKFWLKKVCYKDFGTDECTDSVKTVFHAVKAVPDLVEAGDTEVLEILKHHVLELNNHWSDYNSGGVWMCLEAVNGITSKEHPAGANLILQMLEGWGDYLELYDVPEDGKACLVLLCRLEEMTGKKSSYMEKILATAKDNGVVAAATDTIPEVTFETAYAYLTQ